MQIRRPPAKRPHIRRSPAQALRPPWQCGLRPGFLPGHQRGRQTVYRERLESRTLFTQVPLPRTRKTNLHQVTASQAISSRNAVLGYNASKKLAEKAAWAFIDSQKPVFDLAVICPDIIIGPMLQPILGPKAVNETNKFAVYDFMNGAYTQIEGLTFPFYHFVSVSFKLSDHIDMKCF